MAEGFFRSYANDRVDVFSAGLEPKEVNPRAIEVMREVGIDISHHTSNHLQKYRGQQFDYVITVCDNAAKNCPIFPGSGARLHWPFADPAEAGGNDEQVLAVFRRVRDEIGAKIKSWLAEGPSSENRNDKRNVS